MGTVAVGADLGGTKLLLAAVQDGAAYAEHRVPTGSAADPALVAREIRAFVAGLDARPAALGMAVPGLVDADGRIAACDVLPRMEGWRPADAVCGARLPRARAERRRGRAGGRGARLGAGRHRRHRDDPSPPSAPPAPRSSSALLPTSGRARSPSK